MKVAIYSPYLDTIGGGERYMLSIAEFLSEKHQVQVLIDSHLSSLDLGILKQTLSSRLHLRLNNVEFIKAPLGKGFSPLKRSLFLRQFDCLFYLTDGSLFYGAAKKNILHIQSPLKGHNSAFKFRLKLRSWDLIIYNSYFTKQHAESSWPLRSQVVYPPVDLSKIKPSSKKPYILSVGRFFGFLKEKKHELLIKSFRELSQNSIAKQWSLHLVGSAGEGDSQYLKELQNLAKGLPVYFYPNLEYDKLVKLYGQSSIYWHAAGFSESDPTKMEHFGISTVEAMAGGCIPVVIGKGGQVEIVEDGVSGLLWQDLNQLQELTLRLIGSKSLRSTLAAKAVERSSNFSKERFQKEVLELI